jgi:secondary thiamine-phosphate synthase enzyme
MEVKSFTISFETKKNFQFFDLTKKLERLVKKSKIKNGILNIQTLHTTTALLLNEKENLLLKDFKETLERLFPRDKKYNHDDFSKRKQNICFEEFANGHAHCKAIFLLPSLTLNIVDSKIQLGKWQSVLFLELDGPRKERKISILILGQ